ncbi:hypothetical protein C2G38_2132312 [Gigaspora rosea]|uniref:Uncharacterized protein n=1 Tax=Gigaspora rosea TaxID=44941 RepID=A0A397UYG8_9GLOM|nr:hypothetical protein C2G38_2132312 [Gigaspora rosea]
MGSDILGRTRATLMKLLSTFPLPEGMGNLLKLHRIHSKHESSARANYVPALCTHRPSLLPIEWLKVGQTWSFRGSKSRNKVSVGNLAEGSLKK